MEKELSKPAFIDLLKFNKIKFSTRSKTSSKLAIEMPEWCHEQCSDVSYCQLGAGVTPCSSTSIDFPFRDLASFYASQACQ